MIEQVRASKITIDLPKVGSMPWVQVTTQKVIRDEDTYEIKNVLTRWGQFSMPLSEVMIKTLPVQTSSNDAVTGQELFDSIYMLILLALQDKYGGTINSNQDLVL